MIHFTNKHFEEFLSLFILLADFMFLSAMSYYVARNWKSPGRQLSLGLLIYVLGHTIDRGLNWFWSFYDKPTPDQFSFFPFSLIFVSLGLFIILKELFTIASKWLVFILFAILAISAFITYFLS